MTNKTIHTEAAIIGAGIIGTSIARHLSKYKLDIVVIEKEADVAWGTTKANSGLIHPGYVGEEGTLRLSTCHEGSVLFRKYAQELDIPLKNSGSLLNIFNEAQIRDLETLKEKGQKYGVRGLRIIKNQDAFLKTMEPRISNHVIASLYSPEHSYTSPYEAAIALFENARQNGVRYLFSSKVVGIVYNSPVKKFTIKTKNTLALASGQDHDIVCDYVINAAGVFADEISNMIGDFSYHICPVKSQYFLFDSSAQGLVKRPNIRHPDESDTKTKGMIVGPTIDGNILVGSNFEKSSKDDLYTSTDALNDIKDKLSLMIEDMDFRKVITTFAGIRASADTGDFVLGPSNANERFIHAGGIQSPGLTCAFIIAEIIAGFLEEKGLRLAKDPKFVPVRKKFKKIDKADYMANNAMHACDKDWGEIVCRCEKVSKAQIVDAVKKGAVTLDGVKFRTRAQMGRCQGAYCSLRIMDIISKTAGIPINRITKSGQDSYIARYVIGP
jgi:glycerol-3-phosphate dehydrogenase